MKQLFLLSVLLLGWSALLEVQTKPTTKNKKAFFKKVAKDLLKEEVVDPHGEKSTGIDTEEITVTLEDIVKEDCESVCPPAEDGDFGAHMIQCIQCIAEEFGTPMFPEFLESVLAIRGPELIEEAEEEETEGEKVSEEVEESDEENESEREGKLEELNRSEEEDEPEGEKESELEETEENTDNEEYEETDLDLDELVGDGIELLEELTESFEESGIALFTALLGPCKDDCSSVTEPKTDAFPCLRCMTGHIADESAQFISSALAFFD